MRKGPPQDKTCNSGRFLDSLRSLGMTCRYVIPFNHTGYNRDVAGGRFAAPTGVVPLRPLFLQCTTPYRASSTAYGGPPSPKGKVMGVVPFIHTGCIRNVPGTAHRPFPTYFNGRTGKNNVGCPNNCQLKIIVHFLRSFLALAFLFRGWYDKVSIKTTRRRPGHVSGGENPEACGK